MPEETGPAPRWFTTAIAAPSSDHYTETGGCRLHYVRWASPRPGARAPLVMIHGGGAHAFWWGFLAPLLAGDRDVFALDLSGHGDSGRRDRYPREVWADDVRAVIDDAKLEGRPFLVGHSMGGFVAMVAASRYGDRLSGAILVDSPLRSQRDEAPAVNAPSAASAGWSFQRMTPYADFETARSRFRLLPPQPTPHPFLVDYVAEKSVREDSDGFTWKFDPRVFERASSSSLREYFVSTRCRLAIVRGADSVVLPRETAESMAALLPGRVPLIEIPDAHHHVMFDQPLALLVAIRSLLAAWEIS